MKHVLVVDDEMRIREVIVYALRKDGFEVSEAETGSQALVLVAKGNVDLVVLDVMLPEIDGLAIVRKLREREETKRLPVLFVSARGEEVDRVVGLELGGDDYLVKPFSPRELVARVRALLRRVEPEASVVSQPKEATIRHGAISLDQDRHEVRCGKTLVSLTATEFGVLAALLDRPGVVLSRAQLMQRAYRYDNLITERTIDTHVRRIRAKFREFDLDPIETVHGVGYKAATA